MNRRTLVAAIFVAIIAFPAAATHSYDDSPAFGTWCHDPNASPRYRFNETGSGWVVGSLNLWTGTGTDITFDGQDAVLAWNAVLDLRGTTVGASEQTGGVDISWSTDPTGSADSLCASATKRIRLDPSIKVNLTNSTYGNRFRTALQHEVGHTLRLDHAGEDAPLEGVIGVMSPCNTLVEKASRVISSDERAGFNLHNSHDGTRDGIANGGFESAGYAWAPVNSMQFAHQSSGGIATGPSPHKRVRLRRGATYSVYDSGVRVSGPSPQTMRAETRFLRNSSGQTGAAGVHIYWADTFYQAIPSSGQTACESTAGTWSSGLNENTVSQQNAFQLRGIGDSGLQSGWKFVATPYFTTSSRSGIAQTRLVTVATNDFGTPNTYGYTYFDNTRLIVL